VSGGRSVGRQDATGDVGLGTEAKKKRVVSGMRPTGRLHIGHYFGALQNWVKLQDDREYECFYFIADWHALTSDYADTSAISQNVVDIATDFLAAGLDPKKCVIFLQSLVPEHAELHLLLSMVTPLGWLERVPTYKEQLENIKDKDLHTYGFLGYPVLQCADIVMYGEEGKALVVPVGEDQVSHVELSREIVRKFNSHFAGIGVWESIMREENKPLLGHVVLQFAREGFRAEGFLELAGVENTRVPDTLAAFSHQLVSRIGYDNFLEKMGPARGLFFPNPLLVEPQHQLTRTPRIPGTDGRKMSKSYGNAISLSETDEAIWEKIRTMKTDPARQRRTDKGNPDICPVYDWHKLFARGEEGKKTLDWAAHGCRTAEIGCIECKRAMADNLIKWIGPVRERRVEYEKHPARVLEILDAGSKKARKVAQATMARVREAVIGWEKKRAEITSPTIKSAGARKS
jgi:tryptophanyl-tRNA synthetase